MIFRRIVGYLLIVSAAAGIVFSLVSLVEVWHFQPIVTKTATDNLALVEQSLNTTQDVLTIVGQVVHTTTIDVASLQATIDALAQEIHNTDPMLDSMITLTGNDFPAAVAATQTSLASAQTSALLIDNILAALTSIPFSPVAAYKPAVPLHTALGQVSTSLDTLIPSLATINNSLVEGKINLGTVEVELTNISETTQGIGSTLANAQAVIDQYKVVTIQLKANVEAVQHGIQTWILAVSWILSFVFCWLMIAQLGLIVQGFDLVKNYRQV